MKKVFIVVTMLISSFVMAQQELPANAKQIADKQFNDVKERITTLNEAQTTSLKEVFDKYEKDINVVKNAQDKIEKKSLLIRAETDKDNGIKKILDAEQAKIYETLKVTWKEKRMDKPISE
jgi:transposase